MIIVRRLPLPSLSLVGLALIAAPAVAQTSAGGPLSTAPVASAPAAVAQTEPLRIDPEARADADSAPLRDNKVHGFVEAGVGTGGYRHAAAGLDAPLPGGGEVAIAVDSTQFEGGRRR